jgi:Family of unknown function (DUF6325)
MSTELEEMGPVDFMVIEFPGGRMNGEGLPLLVDLVDRGIVRLLDLVFVRKMSDGSVVRMNITGLSRDGFEDLKVFEGASSGMLDDKDIKAAASVVDAGSTAALVVYENRWAAPLATALRRSGAQLAAIERVPVQALLAALDLAEARS